MLTQATYLYLYFRYYTLISAFTMDGGEVAYLRHAEFGVEENPGTLRCALHTGLRKSAVALRREGANRGMTFLQPLFGGRCACIGVTG